MTLEQLRIFVAVAERAFHVLRHRERYHGLAAEALLKLVSGSSEPGRQHS